MLVNFDIAFLDFDKTLADIHIENFEIYRKKWISVLRETFSIETSLSPILDELYLIYNKKRDAAMYVYSELDKLEASSKVCFYSHSYGLLELIKKNGIPCVIVSNNGKAVVESSLKEAGLLNFVDHIECREPGVKPKPSPDMLARAAKLVCGSSRVGSFIMVGDGVNDIKASFNYSQLSQASFLFVWSSDVGKVLGLCNGIGE